MGINMPFSDNYDAPEHVKHSKRLTANLVLVLCIGRSVYALGDAIKLALCPFLEYAPFLPHLRSFWSFDAVLDPSA